MNAHEVEKFLELDANRERAIDIREEWDKAFVGRYRDLTSAARDMLGTEDKDEISEWVQTLGECEPGCPVVSDFFILDGFYYVFTWA